MQNRLLCAFFPENVSLLLSWQKRLKYWHNKRDSMTLSAIGNLVVMAKGNQWLSWQKRLNEWHAKSDTDSRATESQWLSWEKGINGCHGK